MGSALTFYHLGRVSLGFGSMFLLGNVMAGWSAPARHPSIMVITCGSRLSERTTPSDGLKRSEDVEMVQDGVDDHDHDHRAGHNPHHLKRDGADAERGRDAWQEFFFSSDDREERERNG
jgi:hypothetical protein